MNMKNIAIMMCLALIGCGLGDPPTLEKVEIKKVDFGLTSIFSVHCNNFEEYFRNEIETFKISEIHKIEQINDAIAGLEKDTLNYQPDVRAKLLLYYDNKKVDTVCLSNIGLILNGESFMTSNALVKMIESY